MGGYISKRGMRLAFPPYEIFAAKGGGNWPRDKLKLREDIFCRGGGSPPQNEQFSPRAGRPCPYNIEGTLNGAPIRVR